MQSAHRLVSLALLALACRPAGRGVPDLTLFDGIITKEVVAAGYRPSVPLEFTVHADDSMRAYQSDYVFPRTRSAQRYTVFITVAKGGRFLDSATYVTRYADTRRDEPDCGEECLLGRFPRIGKRAMQQVFGLGPDGADWGLTFTTSDGRYDVRIILSSLVPEGVRTPDFDMYATAQRISDLYDRR
jgi:hypothetical protein